jgi:hypothetical protein
VEIGLLFLVDVGFEEEKKVWETTEIDIKLGFCSSVHYKPTQANYHTGGQIRPKIIPANFGGSRFIGLGAVGRAIFWLCL